MGRIMDAIHYDKIADKLIQFLSKLPKDEDLSTIHASKNVIAVKEQVLQLLNDLNVLAELDDRGWIR
jgi:archaellum component FlaC